MLTTLNTSSLLEYRRIAAGLKFLRSDCTVERTDGIDTDAMLSQGLRQRYLHLLDTAPAHLLPVSDVAESVVISGASGGRASASLPEECRRLLNIRLSAWTRPAIPVRREDYDRLPCSRRELNPFAAPGNAGPVAVLEADGSLTLMPAPEGATVARAMAVTDPGEGTYTLDDSLLDVLAEAPANAGA